MVVIQIMNDIIDLISITPCFSSKPISSRAFSEKKDNQVRFEQLLLQLCSFINSNRKFFVHSQQYQAWKICLEFFLLDHLPLLFHLVHLEKKKNSNNIINLTFQILLPSVLRVVMSTTLTKSTSLVRLRLDCKTYRRISR